MARVPHSTGCTGYLTGLFYRFETIRPIGYWSYWVLVLYKGSLSVVSCHCPNRQLTTDD